MEPNSTLGEPIGVVHVTINGQKVPANVYADRTCIMPDGTIRKVKQEVVDALLAKKRAAEIPAQTPAQQAPVAQPFITRVQSQPVIQPAVQPTVQAPQTTMQYGVPTQNVQNAQSAGYQAPVADTVQQSSQPTTSVPYIPDPDNLPDQMTATRQTMIAQELMRQETAAEPPKKRFGLGKGKKEKPASGVHHAAPAPTQATAEPARPSQKKKSSKVIAAILAVVIVGGVAGYAFVPPVYDGVNGVLTAVTGHQVGVPPVSENGDNDVITPQPTVNQPASGSTDTTSNEVNKVLGDIDMSGDVTIEFYANVKTADGREYKVPLSTANLTDGTLTALLDSGGYPLTQNAQ